MSEYEAMERMGNGNLGGREPSGNPAMAASGPIRPPHYATEAPRVLARMPDLGTSEVERESQLPSLERDGRLLSSRVSVAVLLGGACVILAVALLPFVFFGKDKAEKEDNAGWQSAPPAPTASEAPRYGGDFNEMSQYPVVNGASPYPNTSAAPNSSWDNAPSTQWNPEVASRPNNAWQGGATQYPATDNWGSPSNPGVRSEQPQPSAWGTPATGSPNSDPAYGWNTQTTPPSPTAQEAPSSWGSQPSAPPVSSWSNQPSYGTTTQPSQDTSWNTPVQAVSTEPQPAYTAPNSNRPVGPMMPSTPSGFNSNYEASRTAPAYQNQYQPPADSYRAPATGSRSSADATNYGGYGAIATDAYRAQPSASVPATSQQPYGYQVQPRAASQPSYRQPEAGAYRNDAASEVQATTPYGYPPASNYGNPAPAYSAPSSVNPPPAVQPGYPNTSYQSPYTPPATSSYPTYPTSDTSSATAGYAGADAEPGVARFQGSIEKPAARTTYDYSRPSVY